MDALGQNLETLRRQRACAAIWAAADAAHLVLEAFRAAVRAGALETAPGGAPHYLFRPDAVGLPPDADYAVGDWAREEAYVLGVMQRSTGLAVSWEAGNPIKLEIPPQPACAPAAEPEPKVSDSCTSSPVGCASPPVGCASPPTEPPPGGWQSGAGVVRKRLRASAQTDPKSGGGPSADDQRLAGLAGAFALLPKPPGGQSSWDSLQVAGSVTFSAACTDPSRAEATPRRSSEPSLFDQLFGKR
jgi:hypothetical protein